MTASPCVGVCSIHNEYKICRGCYRTRLEIAKWHSMTDKEKQQLKDNLDDRKELYGEIF